MALVRYHSALFQDQLQLPHIGDVLERIGADHDQVGELAHLHRAQFGADAGSRAVLDRRRASVTRLGKKSRSGPNVTERE